MSEKPFRDHELRLLYQDLRISSPDSAPSPAAIHAWIAKARIYLSARYPAQMQSFNDAATEPSWVDAPTYTPAEQMMAGINERLRQGLAVAQVQKKNVSLAQQWCRRLQGALQGIDLFGPHSMENHREKQQKFGILDAPNLLQVDLAAPAGILGRALIYFDLDNFKAINSKHTERTVDRDLLPKIQQLVADAVNGLGYAYAEGGDEMIVLLPNSSIVVAAAFANTLRELIKGKVFLVAGAEVNVTASFGVAAGHQDSDANRLVDLANLAKARAKAAGKNCVMVALGDSFLPWSDSISDMNRSAELTGSS
ncbi:diguanylate cyclase [Sorangium sp. So ce542]|uniref:diguanylate cyclase n=1 Tax=Sorangium sp. So ce542 TaxID=3133316 RepID=UPI003F627D89